MQNDWLINRVHLIDALKKPSEQQQLLALLFKQANRTPDQDRKLAALVNAEKAGERAAQARAKVTRLLYDDRKKVAAEERKARNHRLIEQGTLIDLAGLDKRSKGELLGLLMAASKTDDPQRWATWKMQGDALLAGKEKSRATMTASGES